MNNKAVNECALGDKNETGRFQEMRKERGRALRALEFESRDPESPCSQVPR